MMAFQANRQVDSADEQRGDRTVESVRISRRTTSRSDRVNRGGKRTVARSRLRVQSTIAHLGVGARLRQVSQTSLRPRGTTWRPAKLAGVLVAIVAVAFMGLVHYSDAWFVYAEDVQIRNLSYLDENSVYQWSGVDGWNVLWLTSADVRENVVANPYIEQADVQIHLPLRILIDVEELQPIALWVTNDATYWLTSDGAALPAIAATDESLPQLIDPLSEARSVGGEATLSVNVDILNSALSLIDRMPELDNKIRYNRNFGLNFPLEDDQVWVYWGDGNNTDVKLENLAAAVTVLDELDEPASLVDVRFIHRPYVR